MRDSERNVGRADHNPEGAKEAARGAQTTDQSSDIDSADHRGHGAHGKGRGEEQVNDETDPKPGETAGSDRGGSAGWGSEGAGGSVIDKRPKKG
jgi:hypothetical protein